MSGLTKKIDVLNAIEKNETKVNFESLHVPELDILSKSIQFLKSQYKEVDDFEFSVPINMLQHGLYAYIGTLDMYATVSEFTKAEYFNPALKILKKNYSWIFSELENQFHLLDILKNLTSKEMENPLYNYFFGLEPSSNRAIVMKRGIEVENHSEEMSEFGELIKYTDYRHADRYFDEVILVGTPNFFSFSQTDIFLAPTITFVGMSFFNNNLNVRPLIDGNKSFNTRLMENVSVLHSEMDDLNVDDEMQEFEAERTQDEVGQWVKSYKSPAKSNVMARAISTTSGQILLVPAGGRVLIVDTINNELESRQLNRETVVPGEILMFKVNVDKDELNREASRVAGIETYVRLKQSQHEWVDELRKIVNGDVKSTLLIMRQFGISKANEQTIGNWLAGETINPKELELMLKFLKFDEKSRTRILTDMRELQSVQQRAGVNIAKGAQEVFDEHQGIRFAEEAEGNGHSRLTVNGVTYVFELVSHISKETILVDVNDLYEFKEFEEVNAN